VWELVASRCLVNDVVGNGLGSVVRGSRFGDRVEEGAVTEAEVEEESWRVWGGHEPRSNDHLWGNRAWRFRDIAYRERNISL
jgi:hypothetical protein